ncbi:MAG: hypothetical protein ABWY56_04500 [Propionibacteriaceae bacterium]
MRRRISMILALAALALVGPGLVPTASAGTNATAYSAAYVNYAKFKAYGDDLINCDNSADGHHAVVQWVDSRNPGKVHTSRVSGYGNCKNALAGVNLAEGSGITFMSCIGEGTAIYGCGDIKSAKA